MRYCKQPTNNTCLPTVILNARRWAGHNCTLKKDFEKIKKQFECVDGGFREKDNNCLKDSIYPAKIIKNMVGPSIEQLKEFLTNDKENHSLILSYLPDHEIRKRRIIYHQILITEYKNNSFLCINNFKKGKAAQYIDEKIMEEYLSPSRKIYFRQANTYIHFLSKNINENIHDHEYFIPVKYNVPIESNDFVYIAKDKYNVGDNIIGKRCIDLLMHLQTEPDLCAIYKPIDIPSKP